MKKKLSLALALGLMVSACASRIDTNIEQKYEKKSQLPINAGSVLVRYDFNPTLKKAGSDHLFSRTLTQAVERWANTRLQPVGQVGIAQVTVRDCSIIEVPNYQNPEKLDGRLNITVSLIDKKGTVLGQAEATVKREIAAPKNLTQQEHQQLIQVFTAKLIDALDTQIEEAILKMTSSLPLATTPFR